MMRLCFLSLYCLCIRKGDTINLDPGPGLYKLLLKTFECQCPHLAMGKCLALFRDMGGWGEFKDSINASCGFWTRLLLSSLSSLVQCLMCAYFFLFFVVGCSQWEHSYYVGGKQDWSSWVCCCRGREVRPGILWGKAGHGKSENRSRLEGVFRFCPPLLMRFFDEPAPCLLGLLSLYRKKSHCPHIINLCNCTKI